MKTTIDIPDPLLTEAKKCAAREKTTFRAFVEAGLRRVLEERRKSTGAFTLRRATFRGRGLHQEMMDASWSRIRDLTYKHRGA